VRLYAERMGRPGLAPGRYFRLLPIGYFEGLDSEPGIAWRAADSLGLRRFLGVELNEQRLNSSNSRGFTSRAAASRIRTQGNFFRSHRFRWGYTDKRKCATIQLPIIPLISRSRLTLRRRISPLIVPSVVRSCASHAASWCA
jgi:hypothetical protein